jgi:8-oxo-dGTP pyrophosphatase MutT (NUDIX family)
MTQVAPIHIASTVMLVREADSLEILMVKRNQKIDFFSGAMVFPGGKLEREDTDPAWSDLAIGWADVPEDERGPRIAALRETFEETGVVAAADMGALTPADLAAARAAMDLPRIRPVARDQGRRLAPDALRALADPARDAEALRHVLLPDRDAGGAGRDARWPRGDRERMGHTGQRLEPCREGRSDDPVSNADEPSAVGPDAAPAGSGVGRPRSSIARSRCPSREWFQGITGRCRPVVDNRQREELE